MALPANGQAWSAPEPDEMSSRPGVSGVRVDPLPVVGGLVVEPDGVALRFRFETVKLTPEESAAGMAEIIANASLEDPGEPINVDGKVIPW